MVLGADYPFLDFLWSMLIFFLWVAWFILLFHVIGDIFRRQDAGGGKKALWMIFVIVVPFLGVLVYLLAPDLDLVVVVLANSDDMARRSIERAQASQAQMDDYVRSVSGSGGGAAAEIEQAKALLDSGAINQAEFEAIKAKALAST